MALGGAITVLMFAAAELVLWICRVEPAWLTEDPYAGFSRHIPHFVSEAGPDGQAVLAVSPTKSRVLNPQRFTARKADGVYRIVCLGGSTTYGRPFYDATSFPGWLRALLPAAQSSRRWEVINAGAISYASYRALGVMEEMARYDPDLFVVYTGHNEFLERRTYDGLSKSPSLLTDTASLVNRTRMATVVRKAFDLAGVKRAEAGHRAPVLGEETKSIPINAVGPEAYHRDDAMSAEVVRHFRASLERMVRIARSVNAGILFVVPGSNLADFAPFRSEHRAAMTSGELSEWNRHEVAGRGLAAAGKHAEAVLEFERAEAIDDRFAALWFEKARSLRALGRHDMAREAYRRAKDEDVCPLRAIGPLVRTVREVALSEGSCSVDFEVLVDQRSEQGLPGRGMFHDHVHPTVEANRHLALAILECLVGRGVVRPQSTWNDAAIQQVVASVEAGIDRQVHAQQLRLLAAMLGWLQQPDEARFQAELSLQLSGPTPQAYEDLVRVFKANDGAALAAEYLRKAAEAVPDSAAVRFQLAVAQLEAGRVDEALVQLEAVLKVDPNHAEAHTRMGIALASRGEFARAEPHLADAARLVPTSEPARNNLGLVMARQGRFEDAIVEYERALRLDPNSVAAHYHLGLALEPLGRVSEAVEHFETVLRLNPGHADARARLRALQSVAP